MIAGGDHLESMTKLSTGDKSGALEAATSQQQRGIS